MAWQPSDRRASLVEPSWAWRILWVFVFVFDAFSPACQAYVQSIRKYGVDFDAVKIPVLLASFFCLVVALWRLFRRQDRLWRLQASFSSLLLGSLILIVLTAYGALQHVAEKDAALADPFNAVDRYGATVMEKAALENWLAPLKEAGKTSGREP